MSRQISDLSSLIDAKKVTVAASRPRGCRTSAIVIDYPAMRDRGTHAVYLNRDHGMRIETVEQFRGNRPWTMAARVAARDAQWAERRQNKATANREPTNRSPSDIDSSAGIERPEIEDDGHPLYWWP